MATVLGAMRGAADSAWCGGEGEWGRMAGDKRAPNFAALFVVIERETQGFLCSHPSCFQEGRL